MGLGGVAIAALPSMIHPKLSFSDSLGGGKLYPIISCPHFSRRKVRKSIFMMQKFWMQKYFRLTFNNKKPRLSVLPDRKIFIRLDIFCIIPI